MTLELRLVAARDADFAAMIAGAAPTGYRMAAGGIETPETLAMLRGLANAVRADFDPAAWMMISGDQLCGLCSLLAAPDADGRIAIGYGVAEQMRGHGICSAAIAALVQWAAGHPAITAIVAETAAGNTPSQRVLANNGFVQTGTRDDPEDGALYCWSLTTG